MRLRRTWTLALAAALLVSVLDAAAVAAAEPPMAYDVNLGTYLKDEDIVLSVSGRDGQLQNANLTFELFSPAHGVATLQGEVTCTYGLPFGHCYQGVLYQPETGYAGPDSFTFTVTDQNTGLSDTGTVTLTLVSDETPPTGNLYVYSTDGQAASGWTRTTTLLVRAQASDDFQLAKLRLSNTGTTVNGMLSSYIETDYEDVGWPDLVPWQTSNSTGGTNSDGTKTVYAQWSDWAGNWSTVKSATIELDTVSPRVTAVKVGFAPTAYNAGVPIRISFTTSEAGGYEMQRSIDGGTWTPMNYGIDSKKLDLGHSKRHSYRYRVRMYDSAKNVSPWKYSTTFKPAYYSQNKKSIRYSGSWTKVYYVDTGWTVMRSKTYGSSATFTFTGKGVSWHTIKGPKRGKAQIYIDGKLVKTVDLRASRYSSVHAYSKVWNSSGTHSIRVRVLGTSGRPLVDVDGFGVLR